MPYKFEVYKDKKGEFRFSFQGPEWRKHVFKRGLQTEKIGFERHRINQEERSWGRG